MAWLANRHKVVKRDLRFAASSDIEEAFCSQHESLLWLAEVVTGDAALARQCVIDAQNLADDHSAVFRDWLSQWARTATVRSAIACVREPIAQLIPEYESARCPHRYWHQSLSKDQTEALQKITPSAIVGELDAFARAVLIVHGLHHAAIQDAALTIGAPRLAVAAGYCRTATWLAERMERDNNKGCSLSVSA